MDDERESPRCSVPAFAALVYLVMAMTIPETSTGQVLNGYAEVQYQKFDLVQDIADRELWVSTIQVDATKRFGRNYDLSAQVYFSQLDYVDRPEGIRSPRGSLRFTHPHFGLAALYRPTRNTDVLGVTAQRDEMQLSGYLAHPGWPFVNGSWIRREADPGTLAPGSTSHLRSINAGHSVGPVALRAAYSAQSNDVEGQSVTANERRNAGGGGTLQLGGRRATLLASYDLTEARQLISEELSSRTVQHMAGLNGGARFGPKTDATLAYNYRRVQEHTHRESDTDDHDGTALGRYQLTPAIQFSGGGGLRTIRDLAQNDVQWYLLAMASAEGRIRHRWTGGASIARSYNWDPGLHARPIDTYQGHTKMTLAPGLDFSILGQVNVTGESEGALRDTLGRSAQVVSYGSTSINARVVRGLEVFVSADGYRSGESLTGDATTSASNTTELRWTPDRTLRVNGSWRRARALGIQTPVVTIWQGNVQWVPTARLDLSAFYQRSDEQRANPNTVLPAGQETWTLRGLVGLTRALRATGVWSTVNPGKPTRANRIEATLTYRFR